MDSEHNVGWDKYLELVRQHVNRNMIERDELSYKRETERDLQEVADRVLPRNENWIRSRKGPILSHLDNLMDWRGVKALSIWYQDDLNGASAALRDLWSPGERSDQVPPIDHVIARVRAFAKQFPPVTIGGKKFSSSGVRMRVIAALLMKLSATEYPPFKVSDFKRTYKFIGYPDTPSKADEATLYEHALKFLDEFIVKAKSRNLDVPRNRLEAQSVVYKIDLLRRGKDIGSTSSVAPNTPSSLQELADELLFDVSWLRRIDELLDDKRQVILQGPPGTGKTYVAQKLAGCLAGAPERVRLVQFHPSYAYEDFVQGFRPTLNDGQPGFELTKGPLLDAAADAYAEPDQKHFLVIDEINRGNLSKVFGELYYLLEYRDHEMRLQYSPSSTRFSLPKNLYIIGTMNTADRSIALVDLALRRRFHFVEFHPDKPPVKGLLERWLDKNAPKFGWIAAVVDRANELLRRRQVAIGPSYFMKKGLKVDLIWEHNVFPYIEEHLYGEQDRLAEFGLGVLRKQVAADAYVAGEDEAPANETS